MGMYSLWRISLQAEDEPVCSSGCSSQECFHLVYPAVYYWRKQIWLWSRVPYGIFLTQSQYSQATWPVLYHHGVRGYFPLTIYRATACPMELLRSVWSGNRRLFLGGSGQECRWRARFKWGSIKVQTHSCQRWSYHNLGMGAVGGARKHSPMLIRALVLWACCCWGGETILFFREAKNQPQRQHLLLSLDWQSLVEVAGSVASLPRRWGCWEWRSHRARSWKGSGLLGRGVHSLQCWV